MKKVDEIYELVVSIGAGVLNAAHDLKEVKITLKEYNYKLDEVLFINKAQDITKLLKEARTKGYSDGFEMDSKRIKVREALTRDNMKKAMAESIQDQKKAQELDQALTKISFYHAIPKKELEKTIKEKL